MSVIKWYEEHKAFVNEESIKPETGRQWFKHKSVRRSFVMIKQALPNMFFGCTFSRYMHGDIL
jgi:hypothetical protein